MTAPATAPATLHEGRIEAFDLPFARLQQAAESIYPDPAERRVALLGAWARCTVQQAGPDYAECQDGACHRALVAIEFWWQVLRRRAAAPARREAASA